ncbi:hypothetical protein V9T40_002447 [Parthenolecanium corni]|uniref:5'-nucleotidase domain-containing protein 1 n=1 Tax=Parthenolecanium corni TaxID=536013 RepID=A0AAN9TKH5_9HEMI
MAVSVSEFNSDDYDCIGFDLDNTLVEYVEFELVTLIYDISANYLVNHREYDAEDILRPITEDIDFLRKGLTLDMERGNVLSLGSDGTVLRVCHGTEVLEEEDIKRIYGPDKKWDLAVEHCQDFLNTWNGENADRIRSSLDYFDMSVPLLFARIVDGIDRKNGNKPLEKYDIWSHILEAVFYVYRTETFIDNTGEYYREVKQNPSKYLKKCSTKFLEWLKSLKASGKLVFLITGSKNDYGNYIADYCLTENWQDYFQVIVYFAKKPGFFVQNRPFLRCDSNDIVKELNLESENSFMEGNWSQLYDLFCECTGKTNPKCLYIGDNLIQDIFTPAFYKCCDTIAVAKELLMEEHPNEVLFCSKRWGSFFYDDLNNRYTVWGNVIKKYSKLCIPSLQWFVDQSLQKTYKQLEY